MDKQTSTDTNPQSGLSRTAVAAVVLAGGRASRFDFEDKALKLVAGKPLIDHVLGKLTPYAANTLISVNRNLTAYEYTDLHLLKDEPGSSNGPLAGIYSAMRWCQVNAPEAKYLACAPADVPIFPQHTFNLLLSTAVEHDSHVTWIIHDGQAQPLFSVWPITLVERVKQALSGGIYGVKLLIQRLPNKAVELQRLSAVDFQNINTNAELYSLESQIGSTAKFN